VLGVVGKGCPSSPGKRQNKANLKKREEFLPLLIKRPSKRLRIDGRGND